MTLSELRDSIGLIQVRLSNEVIFLNNGGCIHFAYYFSKRLRKLGIDHKIVLCNSYNINPFSYLQQAGGINHVMVYIRGVGYIDGHNTYSTLERLHHNIHYKNINLGIIRNFNGWSPYYNSKKYNPIVRKVVNTLLW